MKAITIPCVLFLFLFNSYVKANTINFDTAEIVALSFYKSTTNYISHVPLTATLKYTRTEADSSVDYYVFDISTNGFVIVTADDNLEPVIAYSTESVFNPDGSHVGITDWMKESANKIVSAKNMGGIADTRISSLWTAYKNGQNPGIIKSTQVGPLLTTTWDQENDISTPPPYLYNLYCPFNSADNQRCVTGCVATAMAQIMKYWNYPSHGTGSYSYNDAPPSFSYSYGVQSANFGATTYPWLSMPATLTTATTGAQDSAVDLLMYHAGVSVAMNYGDLNEDGSGAYVLQNDAGTGNPCAQYSYAAYFAYDTTTLQGVYAANYTAPAWASLIENELNAGRVVQYAGWETNGSGHTWVCDGYDANSMFHMNWGWNGLDNGYFSLSNLDPDPSDIFNSNDEALIGIEPPQAPVVNFGATLINACSGSYQFTDSTTNGPTSWLWNFGDGATSTQQNPGHMYALNGTFTVSLRSGNPYGSGSKTITNYITISKAAAPSVNNATLCPPAVYTLSAVTSNPVFWYDSAGAIVSSANPFTTPELGKTTTYWVENWVKDTAITAPYVVGAAELSIGNGNWYAYFAPGNIFNMQFYVKMPVVLQSTLVYAYAAGNETVILTDSIGNIIAAKTVNCPVGSSRITLNFNLQAGGPYYLGFEDDSVMEFTETGATFPYQDANGIVSITGSNYSIYGSSYTTWYPYFYDWIVTEPYCVSDRALVTAYASHADTTYLSSTFCMGSTYNFEGTILTAAGTYTKNITASNGCDSLLFLTLTANPTSTGGTATALSSSICSGSLTSISLSGYAGSVQWQSSSNDITFTNISGATASTYTTPAITSTTYYHAVVTNGTCTPSNSTTALITVNALATVNAGPALSGICKAGISSSLNGSVGGSATGGVWSDGGIGGTFNPAATSLNATYTPPASYTGTVTLTLTTTGGSCGTATGNKTLFVAPAPIANPGTALSPICLNGTTPALGGSIGGSATGGIWSDGGVGGTFNSGATSLNSTYSPPASYSGTIILTLTTTGAACVVTAFKTLVVNAYPVITANPSNEVVCVASTFDFNVATSGLAPLYQWQMSANDTTWANVTNGTPAGLVYTNSNTAMLTATGSALLNNCYYRCTVSTGACSIYSNAATLAITNTPPVAGNITGVTTICPGGTSILSVPAPTGGNITSKGGYRIHTFISSGNFTVPAGFSGNASVLAVAGGGGGGQNGGGGGGGGGVVYNTGYSLSAGLVDIIVGSGGVPSVDAGTAGVTGGGNSVFGSITAIGGGGGASKDAGGASITGGSGGAGSGGFPGGASGTLMQGNAGGNGYNNSCSSAGGGGGGAGSTGQAAVSAVAGNGGAGILNSISGTATYYSGGGGGGVSGGLYCNNSTGGTGGNGGGGSGGGSSALPATGTPNTGGGGGGAGVSSAGGSGGSGIVIVAYPDITAGVWSSSDTSVALVNPSTGVVTGIKAGTATISYTVTLGSCTSFQTTSFTVNEVPNVSNFNVAGATASCIGSPSTVTVNSNSLGNGTYTLTYSLGAPNTTSNQTALLTVSSNTGSFTIPGSQLSTAGATTVTVTQIASSLCSSSLTANNTTILIVDASSEGGIATAANNIICSGNSTSIILTGNAGNAQWQSSNNDTAFSNITGANLSAYNSSALTATTYYRAVVTNGACPSSNSSVSIVTINPVSAGGAATTNDSVICSGNSTSIALTGNTGSIQWQSSFNDTVFANIAGATLSGYNSASLAATTYYRAIVTNGVCPSSNSSVITVTVNPISVGGTATAAGSTVCSGNSTSITLTGSVGSIQWQSSTDNNTFTNILAATSAVYTSPQLTAITYYRAVVTSGICASTNSTTVGITINALSVGGNVIATNDSLCPGNSTVITLSGNTGNIQWQTSADNNTFFNDNNAISSVYITPDITATTYYRAIVTNGVCASVYSGTVIVKVLLLTAMETEPLNQTTCNGGDVTFNVTATGTNLHYQWIKDTSSISNAVLSSYTITAAVISDSGNYNVIVSGACGTVNSDTATLNLTHSLAISQQPLSQMVCIGESVNFSVVANGIDVSYQWMKGADVITGANQPIYAIHPVTTADSGAYVCLVSSNCGNAMSIAANLGVLHSSLHTYDQSICFGTTYNFNGRQLTASGVYTDTMQAANSCDSVNILHLTYLAPDSTSINMSICYGNAYQFNGRNLVSTGTYFDTLISASGCDSIIILNLQVLPELNTNISASICPGSSYSFYGQTLNTSGNYSYTLTSLQGCDSIINLTLSVTSSIITMVNTSFCDGGIYNFNGRQISQEGIYIDTISTATGCDSIITLQLLKFPASATSLVDSMCAGDTYLFYGLNITQPGIYHDTLSTIHGCDSVITLTLTAKLLPLVMLNLNLDTVCESAGTVILNGGLPEGGTYAGEGVTGNTFDPTVAGPGQHLITYSLADNNSCGKTDSSYINVTVCTGIDETSIDNSVSVYPNPVTNLLTIESALLTDNTTIQVYDVTRRVIMVPVEYEKGKIRMHVVELADGTYWMKIKAGDNITTKAFVKIK